MLYSEDKVSDESSDNLYFGFEDEDRAAKSHIVEHADEPDSPKNILLEQKINFMGFHDRIDEENSEIVERSIMNNPLTSVVLSNPAERPKVKEESKENNGVEIGLPKPKQRPK